MATNNKRTHRIPVKATSPITLRRAKSFSDILAQDDVNGILNRLDGYKPDIKDMVVVWVDRNGDLWFETTDGIKISIATWMLEAVKFDLLSNNGEG